jgi:transcriptional regulator with XRE-family HTH domain
MKVKYFDDELEQMRKSVEPVKGASMKLEEARKRHLWTLRDLAEVANVGLATIHGVERGVRLPSLKTIRRVSQALEIDPLEIDEFRAAIMSDGGEQDR